MVESWPIPSLRDDGQYCDGYKGGCHNRMRCSRTNLNGGEREQEHVIGASGEGLQARANLNGGELDEGPILPDGEPGARCVMGMT